MRQPFLGFIWLLCVIAGIIGSVVASSAGELKEARVTEVVKDVKLLPTGGAPRPATVSDEVRDGTAVRTGAESRSELKFRSDAGAVRREQRLQFQ